MKRTLRLDRRYTLGDFKYVTFEDIIDDIPADLAFNQEFITRVRLLQLISFEITYRRYVKLLLKYPHNITDSDKVMQAIQELQGMADDILSELKEIINGKLEQ